MPRDEGNLYRSIETLIREGHAMVLQELGHILHHQHDMMKELRMEREEINRLVASTTENTNATQSIVSVLGELVTSNEKLAADLKAAIEKQGEDVSPEIKAAADAIDANNVVMRAAIPQLATAVTDNTGVAGGAQLGRTAAAPGGGGNFANTPKANR